MLKGTQAAILLLRFGDVRAVQSRCLPQLVSGWQRVAQQVRSGGFAWPSYFFETLFGRMMGVVAPLLLCDFDAPPVASEHGAWFADPSAAELRELLRAYLEAWGPSGFAGRFRNATPDHFAMFVLHRMRAKGHGSLSYVASKRIERVFEEWVEALLEEDKNAEETKE